ncbi:MAG: DUF433 domain-containing protein [Candidatus Lokiarchaeota archaeon]|nr:DUF433 domain-containing protein [Candidatus Lokiarchaeota archaeon]
MHTRISINPHICHGQACVKGTRIPVHQIVKMLANGDTIEDLLEEYPSLEREDILACLEYVASLAEEQVTPLEMVEKTKISEKIMSVNEVAEFFNIKPVTVRRQTERGELPGFKIGNQWRFRESDIEKFIDNQVSQKLFAMKAKNLWDDIQTEVEQSEYTAEDVPELVRQVREKYRGNEGMNANQSRG